MGYYGFILSTLKQESVEVCVYMCEFLLTTVIKSCLFGAGPSHYTSLPPAKRKWVIMTVFRTIL